MPKQRSRLLGSGVLLLLLASTLTLAACNSSSGTSQKAAGSGNSVTGAQAPGPAKASGKSTLADSLNGKIGQP
jgi:predicted small secreted protein